MDSNIRWQLPLNYSNWTKVSSEKKTNKPSITNAFKIILSIVLKYISIYSWKGPGDYSIFVIIVSNLQVIYNYNNNLIPGGLAGVSVKTYLDLEWKYFECKRNKMTLKIKNKSQLA